MYLIQAELYRIIKYSWMFCSAFFIVNKVGFLKIIELNFKKNYDIFNIFLYNYLD